MDWLILHRAGTEFSLPLPAVDRVVSWSTAMTWIGRGQASGLVLGEGPPLLVHDPAPLPASQSTDGPTSEPRFVVLREQRNGDCGIAVLADRVDLAAQSRGTPIALTSIF